MGRQPKYRPIRARCFTIVACYAVFLLIHIYILDGFNNPIFTVMFWYIVGMGSTYILGAVFYGTRIPEKYFPGYFDYVVRSSCSYSCLSLRLTSYSTCAL